MDTLTGRGEFLSLHYLEVSQLQFFFVQFDNCEKEIYLTVLFYISLIISEVNLIFVSGLAIHISSPANCPFIAFIHYPIKTDMQEFLNSRS